MRDCAHWHGFAVIEEQRLDVTLASLDRRIEIGLETVGKGGDMELLKREYQEAGQARGQSVTGGTS